MKNKDVLRERFGDPMMDASNSKIGNKIGVYAGDPPYGAPSMSENMCQSCGMMPTDMGGECSCGGSCPVCGQLPIEIGGSSECDCGEHHELETCDECGMDEKMCECGYGELDEAKRKKGKKKGPSKKTAKKILKGTKTFAQKMQKVSSWAENPAAAAAWMTHKATGKWPSEK